MKHTVRIFEVDAAGKTDTSPKEHENIQIEASSIALAREKARRALVDAGWQVRALSHAVDGGLVAYVVKPDEKPRRRRPRTRRESDYARR